MGGIIEWVGFSPGSTVGLVDKERDSSRRPVVSKKKEVEVSRQGRYCHSERREESLWRRSCLEPKIHACDYSIATLLILRFAQYITNYVMSVMTG